MISINTAQLLDILTYTPPSQNILLVGRHGIGKSEILSHYFRVRGEHVVTLFLGQMADPGDLIGLPDRREGKTSFLAPQWWPQEDEKPVVLFLDELNRARPELLQAVMDLCLSRRLAGRALPPGSRVVAAVNDGDEYQLTPLDPALVSRFNVYSFQPSVTDWLTYATEVGLDQRVIAFITQNNAWLDGIPGDMQIDHGLDPLPNRRAWTRLAEISRDISAFGDAQLGLFAGIVGTAAASQFVNFVAGQQYVSGIDVLLHYEQHEAKIRRYPIHILALINEEIFQHLEISRPDTIDSVLTDEQKTTYAVNLQHYVDLLHTCEDREALAHMANLVASSDYLNALSFIITHTPNVYALLVDYVAQL